MYASRLSIRAHRSATAPVPATRNLVRSGDGLAERRGVLRDFVVDLRTGVEHGRSGDGEVLPDERSVRVEELVTSSQTVGHEGVGEGDGCSDIETTAERFSAVTAATVGPVPVVEAIHVHPVKSCRAVAVDRVRVERTGLAGDRLFQVVDEAGDPITQRQHPRLARVQPVLLDSGLVLEADGMTPVRVPLPDSNDVVVRSLLGSEVSAADAGDEAARWFTEMLGVPSRLVTMTESSRNRLAVPGLELETSFADAAAALVVTTASYRWLAARADEPFGIDRFRPNLTVGGTEPWAEDTWRRLVIGGIGFGGALAWPRCAIPQIDQQTGERHREPARVLRRHRWCSEAAGVDSGLRGFVEGNALFGVGAWIENAGGTVAVGDEVVVEETGAPIIPNPAVSDTSARP